jgi:uncharacterized membrane protein
MDKQVAHLAQQLLNGGFDKFSDRERRVLTHIAKRLHVTRNVNYVAEAKQTVPDRLADCVARFGGSWTFIVIFIATLVAWIGLNTAILARFGGAFDSYPYIFLNLILSMVAALQAPIILMSQNRQAVRDRLAANLDYEVNLKAELEIMSLHEKLDCICVDHLEKLSTAQQEQLGRLAELIEISAGKTPASAGETSERRPAMPVETESLS